MHEKEYAKFGLERSEVLSRVRATSSLYKTVPAFMAANVDRQIDYAVRGLAKLPAAELAKLSRKNPSMLTLITDHTALFDYDVLRIRRRRILEAHHDARWMNVGILDLSQQDFDSIFHARFKGLPKMQKGQSRQLPSVGHVFLCRLSTLKVVYEATDKFASWSPPNAAANGIDAQPSQEPGETVAAESSALIASANQEICERVSALLCRPEFKLRIKQLIREYENK